MNFVKTTINFHNSSKSVTLQLPAFLFRIWPVVRVLSVVGVLLLVAQLSFTVGYDALLHHELSARQGLNKELTQIQKTVDELSQTSAEFFKDEGRLHTKFGLALPDEAARELSTGGEIGPDSMLLRETSPVYESMSLLQESAERLHAKVENNGSSFQNLTKYISQKQSIWRYIPSISPTTGYYVSSFGPRVHPVTGDQGAFHQGMDISNSPWTPIYAPADGVVEVSQFSSTFGNYVVMNHGNGLRTKYGHMQLAVVKAGDLLHRYQLIGYMGKTGRVTGPHLHYEVWKGNIAVNPIAYILPNDHSVD